MNTENVTRMARELSESEFRNEHLGHVTLTEDVKRLIESDHVEYACGQELLPTDEVHKCIVSWVERVIQSGYSEDDAEDAVFTASASLIETKEIPDTPMMEASENEKLAWINQYEARIYDKLESLGIEFDN